MLLSSILPSQLEHFIPSWSASPRRMGCRWRWAQPMLWHTALLVGLLSFSAFNLQLSRVEMGYAKHSAVFSHVEELSHQIG